MLLLLLVMALCFTACTAGETTTEPEPEEPELTQEEIVNYMASTYVNGASTAANYPVETEIVLPQRHFVFEDVVSNPAELLVYEYFYAIGTGDYEYLVNHTVGSNLKRSMQTYVDMDGDALFYEKVTLHEMEIVPIEEFYDFQYAFCEEVATLGGSYRLSEYTVVRARASYRYNDQYLEMDSTLENDEIIRYLLVGRTDGDYVLLEVYGEDYVE